MWRRRRVNTKRTYLRSFFRYVTLALVALGIGALIVVVLNRQIYRLADEVGRLERRLQERRSYRQLEEARWHSLCTLKSVRAALDRFGVDMEWAGADRTIYITRWSPTPPEPILPAGQVARTGTRERRE